MSMMFDVHYFFVKAYPGLHGNASPFWRSNIHRDVIVVFVVAAVVAVVAVVVSVDLRGTFNVIVGMSHHDAELPHVLELIAEGVL